MWCVGMCVGVWCTCGCGAVVCAAFIRGSHVRVACGVCGTCRTHVAGGGVLVCVCRYVCEGVHGVPPGLLARYLE